MEKFDVLSVRSLKSLSSDLSSDRREPDRFLSIIDLNIFVQRGLFLIIRIFRIILSCLYVRVCLYEIINNSCLLYHLGI